MTYHPVRLGSRPLGGTVPLICAPLVGDTPDVVREELRNPALREADAVEVRVDAWNDVENLPAALDLLREVRRSLAELPLILTCRRYDEGGFRRIADAVRFGLYEAAIREGLADAVDMELACGEAAVRTMRQTLAGRALLIVSAHDFRKTPGREAMRAVLEGAIRAGADVAKLAVTPVAAEDVLALLSVTADVRKAYPCVPLITMSMGRLGAITRMAGGIFGSVLTFAAAGAASAPGQLPVRDLRQSFKSLYDDDV